MRWRPNNYAEVLYRWIPFIASLVLILAVFSQFSETAFRMFFNSDTLYQPSVYRDLFVEHQGFSGWHFNPAPNFFPDMAVYAVLMFCCGNNFIVASFLFAFLQYAFLMYLIRKLLRFLFPELPTAYVSLAYLIAACTLLEYFYYTRDFGIAFYLLVNSYHSGAFLMGLCGLWLSLSYLERPHRRSLLLLFALVLLCTFSDQLFLVLFVIPAVVMSLLLLVKGPRKSLVLLLVVLITASALALYAVDKLPEKLQFSIGRSDSSPSAANIYRSFSVFGEQVGTYMRKWGFKSLLFHLAWLSFLGMGFVWWRSRKHRQSSLNRYALFMLLYIPGVIVAPLLSGRYVDWGLLRYNIYPVYLSALNIPVVLHILLARPSAPWLVRSGRSLILGLSVLVLALSVSLVRIQDLKHYFNYYPKEVEALDRLGQRYHLKYGVANYWKAKEVRMFSKTGLKPVAVFDDLCPNDHVSNQRWYFNDTIQFNFVILNGIKDTSFCRQRLRLDAPPDSLEGIFIQRTAPFHYDKGKGYIPQRNEPGSE